MKKRSTSRNIIALLGMGLILFGVVWACLTASKPGELNAAPGPIRSAQRNPAPPAQPIAPLADDDEIAFPTLESEPEPLASTPPIDAEPLEMASPAPLDEPSFDEPAVFEPQPAAAPAPAPAQTVERREIGNQILENVPVAPASIREGLAKYQNARAAGFDDWAQNGGMIITTRFGNTNQLHVVAAPGAAREQITFYDEPVAEAHALPNGQILFAKDTGGDEWFQLFLRSADGKTVQLTEPGTRNQSPVWTKDGSVLVWSRAVKGSADFDVLMRDASGATKVIHKGQGQVSPV
ncbi:MAG: hypothetical protein IKE69_06265, partial [Thermoguttaceae bacterium]|nr:hypothetical protein [Thermoguttaceae bacterium]